MKSVTIRRAFTGKLTRLLTGASLAASLMTGAGAVLAGPGINDWQLARLFHPTPAQLERERQGSVFVYDGLNERDVARAMEQAFDRIGAMMFVNVVPSDKDDDGSGDGTTVLPDDDDC